MQFITFTPSEGHWISAHEAVELLAEAVGSDVAQELIISSIMAGQVATVADAICQEADIGRPHLDNLIWEKPRSHVGQRDESFFGWPEGDGNYLAVPEHYFSEDGWTIAAEYISWEAGHFFARRLATTGIRPRIALKGRIVVTGIASSSTIDLKGHRELTKMPAPKATTGLCIRRGMFGSRFREDQIRKMAKSNREAKTYQKGIFDAAFEKVRLLIIQDSDDQLFWPPSSATGQIRQYLLTHATPRQGMEPDRRTASRKAAELVGMWRKRRQEK